MSVVNVASNIMPSRLGFDIFYARQVKLREDPDFMQYRGISQEDDQLLGPAVYPLAAEYVDSSPLLDALALYSGRDSGSVSENKQNWCSRVTGGVCGFYDSLCKFDEDAIPLGSVTIVPGHIELHKKSYSVMIDAGDNDNAWLSSEEGLPSSIHNKDIAFIVKEKGQALQAKFQVSDIQAPRAPIVEILPTALHKDYSQCTGLVTCHRSKCAPLKDIHATAESDFYTRFEHGGCVVEVFRNVTPLQAVILLKTKRRADLRCFVDSECLACSVRSVIKAGQGLVEGTKMEGLIIYVPASLLS